MEASSNFNLPIRHGASAARNHHRFGHKKLLQALETSIDREHLRGLTEILILQRVWDEQFVEDDDGQLRLRGTERNAASGNSCLITLRPEARFSTKRGKSWVGYKVHLTESCDDDAPATYHER